MTEPPSIGVYHGTEPFCFVSYSHEDTQVVAEEIRHLGNAGFRIYYDEGIHPGHAWHEDLATAIETCELFVLYVSTSSIASGNCARELNFALDRNKPILAIHLEAVQMSSGLQLALGDRQAIFRYRLDADTYRQRVLSAVSDFLSPSGDAEVLGPAADAAGDLRAGGSSGRAAARRPASAQSSEGPTLRAEPRSSRRWVSLGAAVLLVSGLGAGYVYFSQGEQTQHSYEAAIAEIDALIAKDRFLDAYVLMKELDPSEDPLRSEYAERIVVPGTPAVAGENVKVSFKPYGHDDIDWLPLGTTPFAEPLPLPRGELHLKLEAPGLLPREVVTKNPGPMFDNGFYLANIGRGRFSQQPVRLPAAGEVPADWVEIPASNQPFFLTGWSRDVLGFDIVRETPRFHVSQFEVTNAEYKAFLLAGGYTNPVYWQGLEVVDEAGNVLTFDQAMSLFVDETGRPGPSTWALSSYADGEAELPVTGISWYEAAAYARFRDLSLPTIYQWARYALGPIEGLYPLAAVIEEQSNFSQRSLVSARSRMGLGPWGTYHTAGNAREWVWNQAGDLGLIQGSQWQSYGNYSQAITSPRFNRHETNGVRLVQNLATESFDEALLDPIDIVYDDDFVYREPISDEAFALIRMQFSAPRREPLSVSIVPASETELWAVDEHSLRFSDGETFVLYVFTPRSGNPPYQTVLYGPPGNSVRELPNRAALDLVANFGYILRSGRAVVVPIWHATYERFRPPDPDPETRFTRDRTAALLWHRDAADAINYIETLSELDGDRLAYAGYSYGAAVYGPLVVSLEDRLKTAIFVSGGLVHTRQLNPFLDGINWLPRVTQPVLQLNGIYDHIFPWEQSARRQFELLGTPSEAKKLVGYDAGHIGFPENQLIAEIADWLDRYLGPTN